MNTVAFRNTVLVIAGVLVIGLVHGGSSVVVIDPANFVDDFESAIAQGNAMAPERLDIRFPPGNYQYEADEPEADLASPLTGNFRLLQDSPGAVDIAGGGFTGGRWFEIDGGSVEITGLTIRDFGSRFEGGAIVVSSNSSLSITDSTVSGNFSTIQGGGVFVHVDSTLTVRGSTFRDNLSADDGGGLFAEAGSTLDVYDSSFLDNSGLNGGGIGLEASNVLISDVVFSGNSAATVGGALNILVEVDSGPGRITVRNTLFSANTAALFGCAVNVEDQRLPLSPNRILFDNVTMTDGCAAEMAQFENPTGGVTIQNSTFAFVSEGINSEGGVDLGGSLLVEDALVGVAGKDIPREKASCEVAPGTINSMGFNLSSDASCELDQAGDLANTDPMIMRDVDGKLHLLDGSPAIDAARGDLIALVTGGTPLLPCGYKDANGLGRPQDGDLDGTFNCDIGTSEKQGGPDIGGAQTSIYFDPNRSGEGMFVEVLPGDLTFLALFSYQPDASGLLWLVGFGARVGNSLVVDNMLVTSGGVFGADFNPLNIERDRVGGLSLNFPTCEAATSPGRLAFQSQPDSGLEDLLVSATRLATVVNCSGQTIGGNSGRSGTFFDPARDGEGIFVQWLTDGRVFVIWFTYDPQGNQFWTISGEATVEDNRVTASMLYPAQTTGFGSNFNPAQVDLQAWGTITLDYTDCNSIQFAYESSVNGFGTGMYNYSRLTSIDGSSCDL